MTWSELIRRIKALGYRSHRTGKGSHQQYIHGETGKVLTIAVHTSQEVGTGLAHRILKEATEGAKSADAKSKKENK
ncbi:MAG TPA: type II toxin-antitoxin system HicA family toxin [Vicinamibacterales bacterium]|nr:type II toxin-antitoxin system HicA family toxin [Vicinamibacterales bacterium]